MKGPLFVFLLLSLSTASAQRDSGSSTTTFDHGLMPANSFVSASDLAAPSRARKELHMAVEMIHKQDLQPALLKLNKAIAIYPQYALAYNNLAVIYSRLGDSEQENEALQKAISIDPNLELAYLNLGRLYLHDGQYPAADAALNKALALNSHDPVAMLLLSYSEFMDRAFDAAIATCRTAHLLHEPHATTHRVAALAFEMENQGQNAIAELETFLQEQPAGPQADDARKEMKQLKTALHSSDAQ